MRELQLDIGNTRTKYRVLADQEKLASGWCETGNLRALADRHDIERALISCVVASPVRERLTQDFSEAGVKKILWAETMTQFGCIINGYKDPRQLGVDRWLATIAAYTKCREACCVFDFGSAVTVDFVDKNGLHGGGYIVPGSALCVASLIQNTAALKPELNFSQSDCAGTDTEACIQNGIYILQGGFVQAVLNTLKNEIIVCTGGGFKQIERLFAGKDVIFAPDLVLDGLQLVFNRDK